MPAQMEAHFLITLICCKYKFLERLALKHHNIENKDISLVSKEI